MDATEAQHRTVKEGVVAKRPPATDARWLPNYAKAFGVAGPSLLWSLMRLDRADLPEPRPIRVPGVGEVWLRARERDHAIFQQVWVKREYDIAATAPRHWQALRQTYEATDRPIILDAGAHVGMSILWWKRLFPRAHIVAVEPSSANLAVLRRNVAGLDGITVLHAALAGQEGRLRLDAPASGSSATRVSEDGGGEEVPATTVGRIMADLGAGELLLAKIDIEGGEEGVFAGDLDWLDRTHALAVETHDWLWPTRATSRNLWAAVGARWFDVITAGENTLLFRCPTGRPEQTGTGRHEAEEPLKAWPR